MNNFLRAAFLFFVLILSLQSSAQKLTFWKLGSAEKWWVLAHPAAALKAKKISIASMELADSVAQANQFPNIKSGGEKDAFRHALWMALLAKEIGIKKALKLGAAHEKKNRKDFKKTRKEEGHIPDLKSVEMDLFNNQRGVEIFRECLSNCKKEELMKKVLSALYQGELRLIKMDRLGNSLNDKGEVIPQNQWEGKWENERLLISSDYNLDSSD